jgi:hypothetical protein
LSKGAEQLVDRLVRNLARDVPESHVQSTDGRSAYQETARIHGGVQFAAIQRILPHDERLQDLDKRLRVDAGRMQ